MRFVTEYPHRNTEKKQNKKGDIERGFHNLLLVIIHKLENTGLNCEAQFL